MFLFRQLENTSVNNKANSPNHMWEQNMRHNYYCFVASLRCDRTSNGGRSVTPLWLLVSSTSNILTLLWFKPRKVRDKVKVIYHYWYRRGKRYSYTNSWPWLQMARRGGGSHHTQPIYPQERDQVINVKEARWAPGPAWMRMVKRISCPTAVWASVSHTSYPLQTSAAQ